MEVLSPPSSFDVIITAPHVCLIQKEIDRSCDYGTNRFAAGIRSAVEDMATTKLFITDIARMDCDTNRVRCRRVSLMRRLLTKELKRQQRERQGKFLLFDIHSFGGGGKAFGLKSGHEPDVVLLYLSSNMALADVLTDSLSLNRVRAAPLFGSSENDIMVEASNRGGYAVLIEFREETKVTDDIFQRTLLAIQQTVKRMNDAVFRSQK